MAPSIPSLNLADALLRVPHPTLPPYLQQWQSGRTPLSTTPVVVATILGYLATIFTIRAIMRPYKPLKLNALFQIHNLFLTSVSAVLLVCMLEEILPFWINGGFFHAICSKPAWTSRMEFYYMINYYIKYVELIDTIFLVLKKKPLAFLHVFHHAATAVLCYTQLEGKTSVSWVVITLNLAVHVVMYYYYYATAGGAKIWWKKYLTSMQITQFIIDLFIVYFATYAYFAAKHAIPGPGTCAGTEGAALFGCALLTSYLLLFISFYINTYKKPSRSSKAQRSAMNGSAANGHANGSAILDKLADGKDPSVIDKVD